MTGLRDVSSGFYVVPRVSGEFVSLEIRQHNDRRAGPGARIDTQSATTTVRARLGEWVDLGGIDTSGAGSRTGPGYAARNRESTSQRIRIKVECPDCSPP